jgi:hypothetical protein
MTEASPRAATWMKHVDRAAYTLLAAALTLAIALRFYGSLRLQTLHALHWASPADFEELTRRSGGPWSAPLDDVFIHFDFARAIARGFPFEWSPGNGYSSGGTSLLYPFVLAVGFLLGFRELRLMEWAAVVACVCTFGALLGARHLSDGLPRPLGFLIPFGVLSIGALNWSLFSGMEVALFLFLWTGAAVALDELRRASGVNAPRNRLTAAAVLGVLCGLITATRPEGVTAVAVLLAMAAWDVSKRPELQPLGSNWRPALRTAAPILVLGGLPSLTVLVGHAIANLYFTGETTAAGALVKLEANHPYLTSVEVWKAWLFHIKYQVLRVTHHHFSDQPVVGWLVWVLAAASLVFERTRRSGVILFTTLVLWILLVATNGQVRWQNERYTMPAVAWLLIAASLGTGALFARAYELRRNATGPVLALGTAGALVLFAVHQAPRFRDQVWFFGRASRNILDQHVTVGTRLRFDVDPPPHRVLVGDAGAIPYVSDLPALDIIGLGGFHNLPFARATRQHVGAALELIERVAASDRPDLLAIYPGWWGEFPMWFGTRIGEVPVRGNVICGGASKVLYRPNWQPLDAGAKPFSLAPGERVLDALDQADLVSEREHGYELHGAPGFVAMKMLRSPRDGKPLWDAGRVLPPGTIETFRLSGLDPKRPLRLILRAAPTELAIAKVALDGGAARLLRLEPNGGWVEASVGGLTIGSATIEVRVEAVERERIIHHVFAVQPQ